MSEILRKVRASNPIDEELVETIEISHASLAQPLRFARSYSDITADTEAEDGVLFQKSAIGIEYPEKGVTGNQDLLFRIDNVSNEAWPYAKQIQIYNRSSVSTINVIVRVYVMSDLTGPQESHAAEAKKMSCNGKTLTVSAGYKELFNRSAFTHRYNAVDHPGLKYS